MTTRVIHVHDMPNYPDAIYIGRAVPRRGLKASKWANPYKIDFRHNRRDVIEAYESRLVGEAVDEGMVRELPELRGKALACWCRHDGDPRTPDNECHGDVLVDLLETYTDDELRAMGGAR